MTGPFDPGPLEEVFLPRAPLVTVLAQVRWPQVTQLKTNLAEFATQFGGKISADYPFFGEQQEVQVTLAPSGVTQQPGAQVYQFRSADEAWQVTMTESFLTLATTKYESRDDFCKRLHAALEAFVSVVDIPFATRVGFRYVNRVDNEDEYADLPNMVKLSALGGAGVPLNDHAALVHSVAESVYEIDSNKLLVRLATLPAGVTLDPTIAASKFKSWVLDLDAFSESRVSFDSHALIDVARDLSTIGYKFFRWATTEQFLRTYGGEV